MTWIILALGGGAIGVVAYIIWRLLTDSGTFRALYQQALEHIEELNKRHTEELAHYERMLEDRKRETETLEKITNGGLPADVLNDIRSGVRRKDT